MIDKLKRWISKPTQRIIKHNYHYEPLNIFQEGQSVTSAETYLRNVIVYRCVNLVAQSAGHVPLTVSNYRSGTLTRDTAHPINNLLRHPNPRISGFSLIHELVSNKLLFGNAYLLLITAQGNSATELYCLSADQMSVDTKGGNILSYRYTCNGVAKIYKVDPITQQSKILHLRNYHPTDQIRGLSCVQAASRAIELHNKATEWNSNLLKNGARPSGALVVRDTNSYLTDEQFSRLQEQLNEKYLGSTNSGKPLLLEGGLDWKEMSISPRDMDFIESKNSAAREIALAFGVPPQLLGINGDNTYSNMQEARLALWEETILPLLDYVADALSSWLSHWYNEKLVIDFDRDAISALTQQRQELWNKLNNANFMTINEKRSLVGLKPVSHGDTF